MAAARSKWTSALKNAAPAGLPAYVTTRADGYDVPVGQSRQLLEFFASDGAVLSDHKSTGEVSQPGSQLSEGIRCSDLQVELPPRRSVTVSLDFSELSSGDGLVTVDQPLALPVAGSRRANCSDRG